MKVMSMQSPHGFHWRIALFAASLAYLLGCAPALALLIGLSADALAGAFGAVLLDGGVFTRVGVPIRVRLRNGNDIVVIMAFSECERLLRDWADARRADGPLTALSTYQLPGHQRWTLDMLAIESVSFAHPH